MSFTKWLKKAFNSIRINYKSKLIFRPEYQERTDPLEDIAKAKEGKEKENDKK